MMTYLEVIGANPEKPGYQALGAAPGGILSVQRGERVTRCA
jgi:hypothetical protein